MEEGGNFSTGDECQEKRKKEGLPLALFLSLNDRDVHPHCPHASNPYHKCGRYCLEKIPSLNELLDGEKSGEWRSTESEKLEKMLAAPCCPNASNPYHKCAKYCFEKIKQPVVKPKEQKNVHIANRGVSSNCKYAANRYHVCDEYCFQEVPVSSQPGQGMKLKSPKRTKEMVKNTETNDVNPHCRYASNPYHKCAKYCVQPIEERVVSDRAPIRGEKVEQGKERKSDHPIKKKSSIEASDTSHNHTDISRDFGAIESNSAVFIKEEKDEESMLELLDTQPLRIDASDLFKEWAKYCSLKAVEDSEAIKG